MAAEAQIAALYPAVSASQIVVQGGVTPIPGDPGSTYAQITVLYGWSLAESTGSAGAKIRIHDGLNASGALVGGTITFLANESIRDFFPVEAPQLHNNGLFLEVVSGSVEGAIYFG